MLAHYTKAFKQKAVALSEEIGSRGAAEQLGISYYTLSDWRRRKSITADIGTGIPETADTGSEAEENTGSSLLHEVLYLREANALLQRTVDYLLKQQG